MNKVMSVLVVTLGGLLIGCGLVVSGGAVPEADKPLTRLFYASQPQLGDPRLCMLMNKESNLTQRLFEVLPGMGWDNLQNKGKGQVIEFNYSRCHVTDDGRYLLPDNVFAIPLKESLVDTFAEYFDTWHNVSSTTASSINVHAGLNWHAVSVSGSYSREHTTIKAKQIEDKAVTVRVQLRYHRYSAYLQPDARLHPAFKRRLLDMAAMLQLNQTEMAYYNAELVVRDFGTHVQRSVVAGAGLSKTDFLKKDSVASQFEDKTKVLVSASASYMHMFNAGASSQTSQDKKASDSYEKCLTHSYVTSHGGPVMRAFNMSANDWATSIDFELVPMDRTGDPLSFLITEETLPELPPYLVNELEKLVRQSIVHYYERNTVSGCTKMGSPNFSFSANFDDGSCDKKATNMTFGGVYQTCEVSGSFLDHNPCQGLAQVNPKTRAYSCPAGYTAVKLVSGHNVGKPEYHKYCYRCYAFFHCCHTETYQATAVYTVYWCAGLGHLAPDSGYLFAGIYSSTQDNEVTRNKGCPPSYYPRAFLNHKICISDDYELGSEHSVPFGGFMSCSVGNPLSMHGVTPVGANLEALPLPKNSLHAYMRESNDVSLWPKHCPHGYSQHLATIVNGCEVRYCLKSGALNLPSLPSVKIPPFETKPDTVYETSSRVMFNKDAKQWIRGEKEFNMANHGTSKMTWSGLWANEQPEAGGSSESASGMEPGIAAAIAVLVTMVCGFLALTIYQRWQRRRHASDHYHPITSDVSRLATTREDDTAIGSSDQGVSYGSTDGPGMDTACTVQLLPDA